ncbi:MAG: ATP-dependent sacrificial sulfur transferase LarE [Chloroflexi bacterium]|nr:ATP-dependent sacrificial sulfur transferase LarE [Chloroflexota bacterium]
MSTLPQKLQQLGDLLTDMRSVVVAYSGGVDSAFLAAMAHQSLGDQCIAVTASSPSLPPGELEKASDLAKRLGLRHRVIETREVEEPDYAANGPRRCYFCKSHLYRHFQALAKEEGYVHVVDGATLDDNEDFRPGAAAAREWGVRSPLVEVGFTKEEIREHSREMGLPTWDKPAQACLASRVPYGTPVTVEVLGQIGKAERYLHEIGVRQLRVRHHGTTARIELAPEEMPLLIEPAVRQKVVERFKGLGYLYVTVDLEAYQAGSLNRELRPRTPQGQRHHYSPQ